MSQMDELVAALGRCKNEAEIRSLIEQNVTFSELLDYDKFVDDNWVYKPAEHGHMPELGYCGLALAGEAGETAEKIKKTYRDNNGVPYTQGILSELGDVLYYLTRMAHTLGFKLEDIVKINQKKINGRTAAGTLRGSGDNR